jgi:hypothetical protein
MIVQADPFHRSASVRFLPATVRKPTARQSVPPQDTSRNADPRPADIALADRQALPFQNWLPDGPPRVMQLAEFPQAITAAQAQSPNSPQMPPRFGETSVQTWLVASNLSPTAMLAPAESLDATPAAMQNVPTQEMVFTWAGFPLAGSSVSQVHFLPFQIWATAFCTGSCETVQVPTATQFVVEPQDTPRSQHGPGALPLQKSIVLSRHDVPFHTLTMSPWWSRMHSVRLAQVRLGKPPFGLDMVRQVVPFHRSAPVGPPAAMQNVADEQETIVKPLPGGFFSVRHLVPVKIIASECVTPSVVV